MYTKVDSTMTIGDLIAGKDYRVVVYCGYDVENDIPKATENKIGSVIGWFKVENGKIVSDDKTYVRHLKMSCLTFRRGKCCYEKLAK